MQSQIGLHILGLGLTKYFYLMLMLLSVVLKAIMPVSGVTAGSPCIYFAQTEPAQQPQ